VTGVCWSARILPIKFLSDAGSGYTSDAISAVAYASLMRARVSNNSWGGGAYSEALFSYIQQAGQNGMLFVAAAGNNNSDNDVSPYYPASYNLKNIVSVAATDETDQLSYFSNFGSSSVDLGAPGSDILSLRPGGQYAYLSGTSMATPHVAGAAGLLLSQNPSLTPTQIKQLLAFGSDSLAALGSRVASHGRLNAYRALKATVPKWVQPQITSGVIAAGASTTVQLALDTTSLVPGTYTQTLAFSSNDPIEPEVNLPVVLHVLPPTAYTEWLVGAFTTNQMLPIGTQSEFWGDAADPDRDGLSNLFEFITGSDPTAAASANAPLVVHEDGDVVFEFRLREPLSGATYAIEWTPSLASPAWTTTGLTVVENTTEDMPPGERRVRVKTESDVPAAFFRVVAAQAP
jgi:hypothetical protein